MDLERTRGKITGVGRKTFFEMLSLLYYDIAYT